jgi:hypothetical protein
MEATSKAGRTKSCSHELAQLKMRFDQWRAGRKVGQRIPLQLWASAVVAAVEHGVYRVAVELRLDYAVLKRRVAAAPANAPANQVTPRFVELFAPAGPVTAQRTSQSECVVEMANARGARMRVELNGQALAGLPALCSAFWAA